jgi:predicted GNAT superfamily acetyltransferase
MTITCRDLITPEDFESVVDLEVRVWQMGDARGAVPTHLMQAVAHAGGSTIGAFDDEVLVGFAMAFLAREGDTFFPWSHMAAVHPDYQSRGIGFLLKQAQRAWALGQGYPTIGWTFDPLQRRNAAFNLRHLGAMSYLYHDNFYGEMQDGLNAGLPSDRLAVTWRLNDARVAACATGQKLPAIENESGKFLLQSGAEGQFTLSLDTLADDHYRVEIPYDRAALMQHHPERLRAWQMALRKTLQTAFAQGYAAVDFEAQAERCWYVVQKRQF